MKKLLIPLLVAFALLAALALPTAVYAGNLGAADLMLNGINATNLQKPKNRFEINVGKDTRRGIAEFSDGRFIIKTDIKSINKMRKEGNIPIDIELDESGILANQVISYSYHITRTNAHDGNIIYTLFYLDSDGQKQLASWGFGRQQKNREDDAKNFNNAFLNWLNQ